MLSAGLMEMVAGSCLWAGWLFSSPADRGWARNAELRKEVDKLDKRKQGQGISPNFVHSCDAAHLMLTVVRAAQKGITNYAMIHDSFGTTAGDAEEMFMIVREAFVEMYTEIEVLENFRDEILAQLSEKAQKKLKPLPCRGTLELSHVVDSRYCFV